MESKCLNQNERPIFGQSGEHRGGSGKDINRGVRLPIRVQYVKAKKPTATLPLSTQRQTQNRPTPILIRYTPAHIIPIAYPYYDTKPALSTDQTARKTVGNPPREPLIDVVPRACVNRNITKIRPGNKTKERRKEGTNRLVEMEIHDCPTK